MSNFSMAYADITIICPHGRNMSQYLKQYLMKKGTQANAVGMHFKNASTVQKIKNAKTIICVHKDVQKSVEKLFDLTSKQVICLDVSDEPHSDKTKPLTGELWVEHQHTYVYPELERQIKKYLPLK